MVYFFAGWAVLATAALAYSIYCHRRLLRGKLLMAVSYKNIDRIPVEIIGAVDAEGAAVDVSEATFVWSLESLDGSDLGTIIADEADQKKIVLNAGIAGAEGYVKVVGTFPDGSTLEGKSELIKLTPSAAVAFTLKLGEPLPTE